MNKLYALILSLFLYSLAFAENKVSLLANGKTHGCVIQQQSNLLVSLARKTQGRIFSFENQLKNIAKKNKKIKVQIASLKGKTDNVSKSKRSKLKKTLGNNKLLVKEIAACRDRIFQQSNTVNCLESSANGLACDDGSPCTRNETCQSSKCIGEAVPNSAIQIECGFGNCTRVISQCTNGVFTVCFSGEAGDEICNNLDDDCNGETDDKNVCNSAATPTATVAPEQTGISLTPSATVIAIPTSPVPTATRTASATPTRTRTPTPTNTGAPFTCLPPVIPGSNNNPDGCPCNTNGDCIGNCQCGNPCNNTTNPCPSGSTCISDTTQSNFGSCSGVCLPSPFSRCVGGGGNTPICVPNNNGNLSDKGCPCTINGNCKGDCKCGNPCNNVSNPCSSGTTCNPDGSCSGVCKASSANACT